MTDTMKSPEDMTEKERIEFIREHGTEAMKDGLKFIFDGNKYKPTREDMWEERLHRGKKMVETILRKREERTKDDDNGNSNNEEGGFMSFVD